jgi:hypothetical protein
VVWALGGRTSSHFKLLTSNQSWKPASADLGFAEASLGQPDDTFWGLASHWQAQMGRPRALPEATAKHHSTPLITLAPSVY